MESTLKNMVLTLLVITLVASAAIGGIYSLTKSAIELSKTAKVNEAIKEVLPSFDNDPSSEVTTEEIDGEQVNVYPAKNGGNLIGYAIETFSHNGFSGDIRLMVGILADGTINSISVLQQNETPGLGDKIERSKSDFSLQFDGKNPETFKLAVTRDGGEVNAITASTVSSRAFTEAVDRAYRLFKTLQN